MADALQTLADWEAFIGRERPTDVARGLAAVSAVARRLAVDRPAAQTLTIAGTNGKGSTAVFAERVLMACGRRVGTTLSPHLLSFNERIRIDGVPAGDAAICRALAAVDGARGDLSLSYFEYATLAALWLFRDAAVDVAVLEVGLGGRLDSTNVVDADVTVITSIGLDHQALLGQDRDSIAAEKAGIMRPGVPLVYGECDMPDVVRARADALAAPVLRFGAEYRVRRAGAGWSFSGISGISGGSHSGGHTVAGRPVRFRRIDRPRVALVNAAAALQAVLLLDAGAAPPGLSEVNRACATAVLPGRLQCFDVSGRAVIVDVAHNPHAAGFLAGQLGAADPVGSIPALRDYDGTTVAVAGVLADKDAAGIVAALSCLVQRWWFTDTTGERGRSGSALLRSVTGAMQVACARTHATTADSVGEPTVARAVADGPAAEGMDGTGETERPDAVQRTHLAMRTAMTPRAPALAPAPVLAATVVADLDAALAAALAATGPGDRVLVLGSFDIVQRALRWLADGRAA